MVNDEFLDTKKALEKRKEALDLEKELLEATLESFKKVKFKFGDFIYTKDGNKGYILAVYTVNLITYSINHMKDRSPLTDLKNVDWPKDITLESFLKDCKDGQVFYLCRIFTDKGDRYNAIKDVVAKQEDLLPYNEQAKLLYDK